MLEVTETGLRVTDLGSTNGVSVNGTRLPPNVAHILKTHEYVAFGTQAFFVIEQDQ
jgi:pSer/pThr/pTyr-binding forkhead associated (FHA) protein